MLYYVPCAGIKAGSADKDFRLEFNLSYKNTILIYLYPSCETKKRGIRLLDHTQVYTLCEAAYLIALI